MSALLSNCSFFNAAKDLDTEKYVHLVSVCFSFMDTHTHAHTNLRSVDDYVGFSPCLEKLQCMYNLHSNDKQRERMRHGTQCFG